MPENTTELLERPAGEIADPQSGAARSEVEATETDEVVAADLLVEEISIDGMCGVY